MPVWIRSQELEARLEVCARGRAICDYSRPERAGDQKKAAEQPRHVRENAAVVGKKNSEDEGKKDTTARGWEVRRAGMAENRVTGKKQGKGC